MIKGWKNNPEWVRFKMEIERERRLAIYESMRQRVEYERLMYEHDISERIRQIQTESEVKA